MDYFDLANKVLEKLREPTITPVYKTAFVSSTGWTLNSGWALDSDEGYITHTSGTGTAQVSATIADSTAYTIEFEITGCAVGNTSGVKFGFLGGTPAQGSLVYNNGVHRISLTSGTTNTDIGFTPETGFTGSISNVCVYVSDSYFDIIRDSVVLANTLIEDAWNWTSLRKTHAITTVASTTTYSIVGDYGLADIDLVTDATNQTTLHSKPWSWYRRNSLSTVTEATPTYYVISGQDLEGDTKVTLYPTPAGAYTINFDVFQRVGEDLALGAKVLIPAQPIIDQAYASAVHERGDSGSGGAELYLLAQRTLANAIGRDHSNHTTDTDWYVA